MSLTIRFALILLIVATHIPAQVQGDTVPIVLVGCYDGQTYPPKYLVNYTRELTSIAKASLEKAWNEEVDVVEAGDWFFLVDAITMPNVVGAMISITAREGGSVFLSEAASQDFVFSFERGLGLVGIHGVAYAPYFGRISRDVFPLNGDKFASGKISRDGGTTMRLLHEKYVEHPITSNAPDEFEAADGLLVYRESNDDGGWWVPKKGNMSVIYTCRPPGKSGEFPSIVAYEREDGRSVTFAGLKHTDGSGRYEKDLNWYNHSLALPVVRELLSSSLVWVVEPFMEAGRLKVRMNESAQFFGERIGRLEERRALVAEAHGKQGSSAKLEVFLIFLGCGALIGILGYVGFVRG